MHVIVMRSFLIQCTDVNNNLLSMLRVVGLRGISEYIVTNVTTFQQSVAPG